MPYTKTTDFAIKDTYLSGNPAKVVKGAEIDAEFNNIETSFNSIGPFGTAAAANVTTSATDATPGRVLKVGDFGLGGNGANLAYSDANAIPMASGIYGMSGTTNLPAGTLAGAMIFQQTFNGDVRYQHLSSYSLGKYFVRHEVNAVWGAWVEVASSANSLGQGQTWQNVTGTKVHSTTYTNSTGRPIEVVVSVQFTQAVQAVAVALVGGVFITTVGGITGGWSSMSFVVPAGATYSVAIPGGTGVNLTQWAELR